MTRWTRWTILACMLALGGACTAPTEARVVGAASPSDAGHTHRPTSAGETARAWVASGALLLDVRTPAEFAAGHLEGAINIPVQQLEERVDEIPNGRPLVVYCQSGRRSAKAVELLRAGGHEAIFDLGPMQAW